MLSGVAIDIIAKSGIICGCSANNAIWVVTRLINRPFAYNRQVAIFLFFIEVFIDK